MYNSCAHTVKIKRDMRIAFHHQNCGLKADTRIVPYEAQN